jgi:hypothetical protein
LGIGGTRTMLAMEDRERASGAETLLHLHLNVTPSTRSAGGAPHETGTQRVNAAGPA